MRKTLAFIATQLMLLLRDRQLLFWNVLFFLLMLLVFLGLLSGGDAAVRVMLAASVVTIAIMASALFSVAVGLTAARERGVFRRYALTPAPPALPVAGAVIARALLVLASAMLQVLVAGVMFDVPWSGGWVSWLVILAAGTGAFAAVGFAIAAFAPSPHVANTIANLFFIPMMALSGTAVPAALMPETWQNLLWVLPSATILEGLLGALVRAESAVDHLPRVGYLAGWTVIPAVAGAYRWRRRDA